MVRTHLTTSSAPIGLDIGSRYLKAAQFPHHRAGFGRNQAQFPLTAMIQRSEPGTDLATTEAARLRDVLHRRGFQGRQIILAIPTHMLLTSVLELPPATSGAPLQQIATAEMGRAHRLDPAALEAAFWPLPPAAGKQQGTAVMAAACQHEHAASLIGTLTAVEFDVLALDTACWALARACQTHHQPSDRMIAVVDIGWQHTVFFLLHQQAVVYERVLSGCGLESLCLAIQRGHRIPADTVESLLEHSAIHQTPLPDPLRGPVASHFHALAKELQLSLAYAAHQYPQVSLHRLVLVGGGASLPGLDQQLSDILEITTNVFAPAHLNPEHTDPHHDTPDHTQASTAVALGLARYPLEDLA